MSPLELVGAYLRQRARLRLLVPLSTLLALAGWLFIPASTASPTELMIAALAALGFILSFRIWDDIEDRDIDRERHPDRVLPSAPTTTPFYAVGLSLAALSTIPLISSPFALRRVAAVSLAAALLSIWYGARSPERRFHAFGEHVLAIKYPLIAYAVAPGLPADIVTPRVGILLSVLYLLICVYEYTEDIELRQIFTSRRSLS
jgi:4-hydroxybenzoate polyprenyltransferase